ncbi:MAG: hypothetical protein ACJ8LG_10295 [Massilia sp.]
MTTLTIKIPDQLAEQAKSLGLLEPDTLVSLLREGVRQKQIADLFDAAHRLAEPGPAVMTPEEVQEEIAAAWATLRARRP